LLLTNKRKVEYSQKREGSNRPVEPVSGAGRKPTLEYAIEKRNRLLSELTSDEHYEQTDTVAYGHHDPFDVPAAACEKCGGAAKMMRTDTASLRWFMQCEDCGSKSPEPQKRPWQAALAWNQINLLTQSYRTLPMFGLAQFTPSEARARMVGIRRNLELRKKLVGIERTIANETGRRPPGRLYQQRLEAYLKWAMLALRLVKVADQH
jgi:hypothetical protein